MYDLPLPVAAGHVIVKVYNPVDGRLVAGRVGGCFGFIAAVHVLI